MAGPLRARLVRMTTSGRVLVLLLLVALAAGCAAAGSTPPSPVGAPRGCWNPDPASLEARPTFFLFCLQTP